jgi:hypothetical protein
MYVSRYQSGLQGLLFAPKAALLRALWKGATPGASHERRESVVLENADLD